MVHLVRLSALVGHDIDEDIHRSITVLWGWAISGHGVELMAFGDKDKWTRRTGTRRTIVCAPVVSRTATSPSRLVRP